MSNKNAAERPNIIIFNPDQYRGDVLGHLGNEAAYTPNLDQLVESDGVSFSNAFCQNPVCTPSRCSFMTGWYPHTAGHRTMYHMLHPERGEPNLLQTLMRNNYYVWWGGKNDLFPGQDGHYAFCNKYTLGIPNLAKNVKQIYQQYKKVPKNWRGEPGGDNYYSFMMGKQQTDDNKEFYTHDTAVIEAACKFIKKRKTSSKPFCVYLPISFPHPPYIVDEKYYNLINKELISKKIQAPEDPSDFPMILQGIRERQNMSDWSDDQWSELRAVYYGMCAKVDDYFGRLINTLKASGQYDNTLILFISDHGDFTGDYGLVEKNQNTFQDSITRVPFIVKPPSGKKCKPKTSGALVELVDMCATIYDYANIEPNYIHFGKSLRPLIQGDCNTHRKAVFCEGGRLMAEKQAMDLGSSSTGNPTGLYYPRVSLQITDEKPYHGKAVMCRTDTHKYVKRLYEKDELYDLIKDPFEQKNIIDDSANAHLLDDFNKLISDWYLETGDFVPPISDKRYFKPSIYQWLKNLLIRRRKW